MVGERHAITGTTHRSQSHGSWRRIVSSIVLIGMLAYGISALWPSGRSDGSISKEHTIATIEKPKTPAKSILSTSALPPKRQEQQPVEKPHTSDDAGDEDGAADTSTNLNWRRYTVRKGDALSTIFQKQGLPAAEALRIASHPKAKPLGRLRPDQILELGIDHNGAVLQVRYRIDPQQALHIDLTSDEVETETVEVPLQKNVKIAHGSIKHNLFMDGARAGLDDKLIMKLVAIFGWDIDFALDLRKGDQFAVAYEELYDGDKKIDSNNILAAQFINQGRLLSAFRHEQDNGRAEYYDAEGNNLRGTFLRTPMKISRITSGFSKRRYHPVLKKWRAHRGVDYGAPTGTPVLATADGRISHIGTNGGYGKCVVLRHGGKFSTLYAHLSRYQRTLRNGTRIRQGQVIGYVGSTGLATGPHLHYEFRVNNVHQNPLTQTTAKAAPIPESHKAEFLANAQMWNERLAQFEKLQVASK